MFKSRFSKKHLEIPTKKRIFAATNPTMVRLSTMRTTVGLRFLYGYMNYNKTGNLFIYFSISKFLLLFSFVVFPLPKLYLTLIRATKAFTLLSP